MIITQLESASFVGVYGADDPTKRIHELVIPANARCSVRSPDGALPIREVHYVYGVRYRVLYIC